MEMILANPIIVAGGLVLLTATAGFLITVLSAMKQTNKQYTIIEDGFFEELFGIALAFVLIVIATTRIILYGGDKV